MKKLLILSLTCLIVSFLGGCKKDPPVIPPTIVNGQVLEQGSNKPIEGVKVVLIEVTFSGGLFGTQSYYPIDTILTDKEGKYTYKDINSKSNVYYTLRFYKSQYFNIDDSSDEVSVKPDKTSNITTKLYPFAWLSIRVINVNGLNDSDILSIGVTNENFKFHGSKVNDLLVEKVRGGRKQKFSWIIQRDLKWGQVFIDSTYCKGHDTTYYQLKY